MRLISGSLSFDDARAWVKRNWPDLPLQDVPNVSVPLTIGRYHKQRGNSVRCLPMEVANELVCFIVVYDINVPLSTGRLRPNIREYEKTKAVLFNHPGDKELAERTHWMTLYDPYHDIEEMRSGRDSGSA